MPVAPSAWAAPCRRGQDGAVIGRLHHVIVDCPDPAALAGFYAELLGLPITWQEDDFAVVARDDKSSGIGFQLAPDFQPPQWPDPSRPLGRRLCRSAHRGLRHWLVFHHPPARLWTRTAVSSSREPT